MTRARIEVVAGPTAAGKTGLAVRRAQQTGAVILSADAMQVYRGMDVGTAKASLEERGGVRHFGLDVVDPWEPFDAAAFVALGDAVIAEHERVIVAGGTSLYVHALVRGLVQTPAVDPALRTELQDAPDLYDRLVRVDPALAARLHPNDRVRLLRGVEVYLQTGERLSDLQAAHAAQPDRYEVDGVWLDPPDLDRRIDTRAEGMFAGGLVEETRRLLEAGVHRDLKPMRSLGYRHVCDHLLDGLPVEDALHRTQRDTRRFARKQRTWGKVLRRWLWRADPGAETWGERPTAPPNA